MQARKASSLAEVEGRTGDMRLRSVIYAPGGIIGEHISTKMSRYARLTLGIRLQWHYLGAYLRNESKGEKQASESPMAARCSRSVVPMSASAHGTSRCSRSFTPPPAASMVTKSTVCRMTKPAASMVTGMQLRTIKKGSRMRNPFLCCAWLDSRHYLPCHKKARGNYCSSISLRCWT